MRIPKRGPGKSVLPSLHLGYTGSGACPLAALNVFQTKRDYTFEGCKGVVGIADEIAVFGKINEEHDRNMHVMLKRLQTFLGDSKLLGPCYSKPKNTDSSRLRGVPHLPVRLKLYRLH